MSQAVEQTRLSPWPVVAALAGAAAMAYPAMEARAPLATWAVFGALAGYMSLVDIKTYVIHNRHAIALTAVSLAMAASATSVMQVVWALVTAVVVSALPLVLWVRGYMGGGDVKVAPAFTFAIALVGGPAGGFLWLSTSLLAWYAAAQLSPARTHLPMMPLMSFSAAVVLAASALAA